MNVTEAHMEEKAVHSWSRLSSAGQRALEDALRVFNPMSKDLTDTETQLVTFLQGLREEGYQPTILSSKDVYGYNSTTAVAPSQIKCAPKMTSTVSVSSKTQSKTSNKVSSASMAISVNSAKVPSKHSPRGSTNLLLTSLSGSKSKASTVGFPSSMYPNVYPAMRLSVVLEALVPFKTSTSLLEGKLKQHPMVVGSNKQSLKGKSTKVSEHNTKSFKCLIEKTPPISGNYIKPLNGIVLKGPNGRVLKENNACTASGILNGRLFNNSSKNFNGIIQTKLNSRISNVFNKECQFKLIDSGKKRKPTDDVRDAPPQKRIKILIPLKKKSTLNMDKFNQLRSRVIKVDKLSSDDEVREHAQNILQVNLSPVIRLHPLFHMVP